MKTLFADTFFFFAYLNADDDAHAQAVSYFDSFTGQILTTAWVVTELADGMAGLGDREIFTEFHQALRSDASVTVIAAGSDLYEAGLALYSEPKDKEWSLTDCISFAVMRKEGLSEALTGDHHFKQAGFTVLFH